jgi:PhnB protein
MEDTMPSILNPYLSFATNARQAIEFYRSVFGGEVQVMPFGDMAHDASQRDLVMHAQLNAPNGFVLMASDTPPEMQRTVGNNMSVSLSGNDEAELRGYWDKLAAGGTVAFPLAKAPWGDTFGMLTDKFGIPWMVNVAGPRA